MKRSWRVSGVGEETQESTIHNNMTNTSNGDRPREGNRDARKNPRSLSFEASSLTCGGGAGGFAASAHLGGLMDNTISSSNLTRPVSRSLSGPHSPPHNPPRLAHSRMTLDQQKLAAIEETLPAVTRKVTACAACRKQKIKCIMDNDEPPCQRCVQRGLSCVLNRSLQSLMNDTRRIHALQVDLHQMHSVLTNVCQAINIKIPPALTVPYTTEQPSGQQDKAEAVLESQDEDKDMADASPPMSPSDMKGPIDTFLEPAKSVAESPASAAVASPHASIHSHKRSSVAPDIITKGIVSLSMAESLIERYTQRLDHYLYGIGNMFTDLKSLRKLSPVLLAAVCAVSALHEPSGSPVFEACNAEFLKLVSQSMFEKRGVEFLRALCIGSYWLSDASRILSSDALRRSSDVRLQKYFYQVTVPDSMNSGLGLPPSEMVDRVRLWYLFYISDQHLSILYNRDPIVNADQDIILGWQAFLESEFTDESDVRIASQVVLLQMMSHIRSSFGPESTEPLSKGLATSVKNFNGQIDTWFSRFSSNFSIHNKIGDFPHKGLTLHYHFAKLYLGHHVFRGIKSDPIPVYFLPAALMAHGAATFIFELILSDDGLTDSLLGIPFYFHVMISFAGHFLLSCSQYWEQLSIDVGENLQLMGKAIGFFKGFSCVEQHPMHKMTVALENKYLECRAIFDRSTNTNPLANNNPFNGNLPPDATVANYPPQQQWAGTVQNPGNIVGINNTQNMRRLSNQGGANLPSSYTMVPSHGDTGFDINFQDLDGFNFPDLDFTH